MVVGGGLRTPIKTRSDSRKNSNFIHNPFADRSNFLEDRPNSPKEEWVSKATWRPCNPYHPKACRPVKDVESVIHIKYLGMKRAEPVSQRIYDIIMTQWIYDLIAKDDKLSLSDSESISPIKEDLCQPTKGLAFSRANSYRIYIAFLLLCKERHLFEYQPHFLFAISSFHFKLLLIQTRFSTYFVPKSPLIIS